MKKQGSTASIVRRAVRSPYIPSKSPSGATARKGEKGSKASAYQPPRKKLDPGGESDGRTSGNFTGQSSASLQGIFDSEWIYGYMVCSPIDSVLGPRLGGFDRSKLGSVLIENEK